MCEAVVVVLLLVCASVCVCSGFFLFYSLFRCYYCLTLLWWCHFFYLVWRHWKCVILNEFVLMSFTQKVCNVLPFFYLDCNCIPFTSSPFFFLLTIQLVDSIIVIRYNFDKHHLNLGSYSSVSTFGLRFGSISFGWGKKSSTHRQCRPSSANRRYICHTMSSMVRIRMSTNILPYWIFYIVFTSADFEHKTKWSFLRIEMFHQ